MGLRYALVEGQTGLWEITFQNRLFSVVVRDGIAKTISNKKLEIVAEMKEVPTKIKNTLCLKFCVLNQELFDEYLSQVEKENIVSEAERIANGLA